MKELIGETMTNKYNLQPWYCDTSTQHLRRFGKTLEELGELQAVVARCIIQGIDEVDPSSQKVNRLRLEEEIADVYAQLFLLEEKFNLDVEFVAQRMMVKTEQMYEWERLVEDDRVRPSDDLLNPPDDFMMTL